jgi:hypothetical protein
VLLAVLLEQYTRATPIASPTDTRKMDQIFLSFNAQLEQEAELREEIRKLIKDLDLSLRKVQTTLQHIHTMRTAQCTFRYFQQLTYTQIQLYFAIFFVLSPRKIWTYAGK